jgi:hypothetical protein
MTAHCDLMFLICLSSDTKLPTVFFRKPQIAKLRIARTTCSCALYFLASEPSLSLSLSLSLTHTHTHTNTHTLKHTHTHTHTVMFPLFISLFNLFTLDVNSKYWQVCTIDGRTNATKQLAFSASLKILFTDIYSAL